MELLRYKNNTINKARILEKFKEEKYISRFLKYAIKNVFYFSLRTLVILKHKFFNLSIFRLDNNEVFDWTKPQMYLDTAISSLDRFKPNFILNLEINDLLIYLDYLLKKNKISKKERREKIIDFKELLSTIETRQDLLSFKEILKSETKPFIK